MIECNDCAAEIKDVLHECNLCSEVICSDCKKNHDCLTSECYDVHPECRRCGGTESDVFECAECNELFCSYCLSKHVKEEISFTKYSAEDYINHKIVEKL